MNTNDGEFKRTVGFFKFEKENHAWGVKKESECLPFIKKILGDDVKHNKETFNSFDFSTKDFNIELKSRRIDSNVFDTTFSTLIKRDKANKSIKKVLWLFNFTDGLFYLDFTENKEVINSLKTDVVNTRYGERANINIPINLLKKWDTFEKLGHF